MKQKILFALVFLVGLGLTPFTQAISNSFTDVSPGEWYTDSINHLSLLGLVEGYPDQTYKPDEYISRAEVAVMLDKLLDHLENSLPQVLHYFQEPEADEWLVYENEEYGFSLKYNEDYVLEESSASTDQVEQSEFFVSLRPKEVEAGGKGSPQILISPNSLSGLPYGIFSPEIYSEGNNDDKNLVDYSVDYRYGYKKEWGYTLFFQLNDPPEQWSENHFFYLVSLKPDELDSKKYFQEMYDILNTLELKE